MAGFRSRDDRSMYGQREVDMKIEYQVCLEFCQINIQGSIKYEGHGDGRHNLANSVAKVSVMLDVQYRDFYYRWPHSLA